MCGALHFNLSDNGGIVVPTNHKLLEDVALLAHILRPVLGMSSFRSIVLKIDDTHKLCIRKQLLGKYSFTAYYV